MAVSLRPTTSPYPAYTAAKHGWDSTDTCRTRPEPFCGRTRTHTLRPAEQLFRTTHLQYTGCHQLEFAEHKIVNHSVPGPGRFVSISDPAAHTQNIETRHRHLKDTIRAAKDDTTLGQYIAEFTYRERRFKDLADPGRNSAAS